MARWLLFIFIMPRRNASHGRHSDLRLEVIDELGRVVEAIYVPEISGTFEPPCKQRSTADSSDRRRKD